jgi:hypothetical protein
MKQPNPPSKVPGIASFCAGCHTHTHGDALKGVILLRGLAAALEGEALAAVHANQLLPVSSRLTWSGALA